MMDIALKRRYLKKTEYTYSQAASDLGIDVSWIVALAIKESKRSAFDENGMPTVLFEPHIFRRYTGGRFDKSHPHLSVSYRSKYKYGKYSEQRGKLAEAMALNWKAAHLACSWGKFQIMGFSYKDCGYDSLSDFIDVMHNSEEDQLKAVVGYIKTNKLARHLNSGRIDLFAKGYNGSDYERNNYDNDLIAIRNKVLNSGERYV